MEEREGGRGKNLSRNRKEKKEKEGGENPSWNLMFRRERRGKISEDIAEQKMIQLPSSVQIMLSRRIMIKKP